MLTVSSSVTPVHSDPDSDFRPTLPFDAAWPADDVDNAWLLGFALGRDSEISEPPAGYSEAEAAAFRDGWGKGQEAAVSEEFDHLADCFEEPDVDIDWYEAARVHGHRVALMTEGSAR